VQQVVALTCTNWLLTCVGLCCRLQAEGCDCKPVYDAPFIAMIVLAVTTIVVGTLNG
jgi:hypothetical protein